MIFIHFLNTKLPNKKRFQIKKGGEGGGGGILNNSFMKKF